MVPWEIQRWNSTAAWRSALVVRMLSTATVEGKLLFPRVRLHASEVGWAGLMPYVLDFLISTCVGRMT